jgi:phytanoyl-CoA hydroxylase
MIKTYIKLFVFLVSMVSWGQACETFQVHELKDGKLTEAMVAFFHKNGYLIIKDFFPKPKVQQALEEYKQIVRKFPALKLGKHFFETQENAAQGSDRYFFESAEEIWPFYNSSAKADPIVNQIDLSAEKDLFAYLKVMNKVAHNLHAKHPFFRDLVTKDQRLKDIAKDLGYDAPSTALYQTTIISKSLVEDSKYTAHQDGTFIGAKGKVLAYWIPLTPSTKDNGCLWGIPGSHHLPITWWYRKAQNNPYKCQFVGEKPSWDLSNKVYLEINPGDLLIFPGSFVHGSDPASKEPRAIHDLRVALTYHLGPTEGWEQDIWLKLSDKNTIPLFS